MGEGPQVPQAGEVMAVPPGSDRTRCQLGELLPVARLRWPGLSPQFFQTPPAPTSLGTDFRLSPVAHRLQEAKRSHLGLNSYLHKSREAEGMVSIYNSCYFSCLRLAKTWPLLL